MFRHTPATSQCNASCVKTAAQISGVCWHLSLKMSDCNRGQTVTYTTGVERGKNASETCVIFSEANDTESVQKSDFFQRQ